MVFLKEFLFICATADFIRLQLSVLQSDFQLGSFYSFLTQSCVTVKGKRREREREREQQNFKDADKMHYLSICFRVALFFHRFGFSRQPVPHSILGNDLFDNFS